MPFAPQLSALRVVRVLRICVLGFVIFLRLAGPERFGNVDHRNASLQSVGDFGVLRILVVCRFRANMFIDRLLEFESALRPVCRSVAGGTRLRFIPLVHRLTGAFNPLWNEPGLLIATATAAQIERGRELMNFGRHRWNRAPPQDRDLLLDERRRNVLRRHVWKCNVDHVVANNRFAGSSTLKRLPSA